MSSDDGCCSPISIQFHYYFFFFAIFRLTTSHKFRRTEKNFQSHTSTLTLPIYHFTLPKQPTNQPSSSLSLPPIPPIPLSLSLSLPLSLLSLFRSLFSLSSQPTNQQPNLQSLNPRHSLGAVPQIPLNNLSRRVASAQDNKRNK
jgi:hypothetical protein